MEEESNKKGRLAEAVGGLKGILTGESSRIPETTAFLMIGTALFFDLLSIVPVVNWIAAIFAWMTFGLWFLMRGVGFINPKKLATWGVAALIGLIPALSAIPELTLAVAVTIMLVRAEDRLGIPLPTPGVREAPVKGGRSKLAKVRLQSIIAKCIGDIKEFRPTEEQEAGEEPPHLMA
jgi:hypothetical protein